MPSTETALMFDRVTGTIAADVRGFDVHNQPGREATERLQWALAEYGVLFFHASDGQISNEEYLHLSSLFGEILSYPYGDQRRRSNSGDVGEIDFAESSLASRTRTNYWHTDGSPQECPPYAAMLTPTVLPSFGGDTMWATMTGAYEALSSRLQRLLDGMEALHSTDAIERHYAVDLRGKLFGAGESHAHPVVPVDPVTKQKFLYVNENYTESFVGMTPWESERLLDMLAQHLNTPEFHVRVRWQLGTVAVWHERVSQHRAVADFSQRRALRRIVLKGVEPPRA